MLDDATRHGLGDLVTHIHAYQQLIDPQSHDTATPTTEAPQQAVRQPSPTGTTLYVPNSRMLSVYSSYQNFII